ncbi:MAG: tyrosine-type recombinase/integrase [Pseudomonadota bacterium]|nr:tyrosine-type recombinase/integrase [Pseudomonadota bacterium]
MIKTRLKYCVFDPDRHGNPRYYVRVPGRPKIRIRETFEDHAGNVTEAFMSAYRAALNDAGEAKPARPRQDSFRWLIDRYCRSAEFAELGEATRIVRRGILDRFCEKAGDLPYRRYRQSDMIRSRDARRATPGAADNLVKAVGRLFSWAVAEGLATYNPATGVKRIHKSDGWQAWSPEDVARFRAHHPIGTTPRLALELLINVGARRSDAVRLGRQHESGGWLRFTAFKNREKRPVVIEVPIRQELREALDAAKTGDLAYIVGVQGRPFTVESFGVRFRGWCDDAGLPGLSAHGLRKAAAVTLAENKATAPELCAIFGWSKLETAEVYIRAAQKKKMAGNAFARLDDYRKRETVSPRSTGGTKRRKNHAKSTPK